MRRALSGLLPFLLLLLTVQSLVAAPASAALPDAQRVATCVARDTGQTAAAMLAPDARFDCTTPTHLLGPGDYWVRSRNLAPIATAERRVVHSTWPWQHSVQLFAAYPGGRIVAFPIDLPASYRGSDEGTAMDRVLPATATPPTALLWRVRGSANTRRIAGDPVLASAAQVQAEAGRAMLVQAAFVGFGLALFLTNLALWVGLRQRFQLAYCALTASLVLYASLSGGVSWLAPGIDRNLLLAIIYGLHAAGTAAALWFTAAVVDSARVPRRLRRASDGLTIALFLAALGNVAGGPDWLFALDRGTGLLYAGVLALVPAWLHQAARQGRMPLLIIALAWIGPAPLLVMRIANTFHLGAELFAIRDWTVMLLALQALLSSLAIAYRINRLGRERDEARAQEMAARHLADTDPLTGLYNRRAFLDRVIGRPGTQTLLLADLDHFKAINETIGHDGGDEVLRGFARALAEALPRGAIAARLGGEEFAIVADAAAHVPPRLVTDALGRVRTPFDLPVTTSIGTCSGPLGDEEAWKSLYRRADQALFAAKAAGRDRVRDAGPVEPCGLTLAA